MSKLQNKAQILWIPTHEARINTSFEPDVMEILDAVTKIKEFNLFQETTFKIGLAKSWMGWGEKCDEENLRVEHLNLAIDVIAYYMVKCRSLNLTKFTTTNTTVNKKNLVRCRVETHLKFWMDPSQYHNPHEGGFHLSDHACRRIRQEIRQLFRKLTVCPPWSKALKSGDVTPPVMYVNGIRRLIPAPRRGDKFISTEVLGERAKVRVEAYKKEKYSTILPAIPSYDWDRLREIGITGKKIVIPKELMLFLSEENQTEETEVKVGKVTSENFYPSKVIRRFCTMTEEEENAEQDEEYEMVVNVNKDEYNELKTEGADQSLDDEEDPEEPRRESSPEPEWKTKPLPKINWAQETSDDEKKMQVDQEDLVRMDPAMRNPSPPQKSPRKRSRSPSPTYSEVSMESYNEEIQQMEEMLEKQTNKINREVERLKEIQGELERLKAKKHRTKKLQLSLRYLEKVSKAAKERGRKHTS
jgi:hypothetical protein